MKNVVDIIGFCLTAICVIGLMIFCLYQIIDLFKTNGNDLKCH